MLVINRPPLLNINPNIGIPPTAALESYQNTSEMASASSADNASPIAQKDVLHHVHPIVTGRSFWSVMWSLRYFSWKAERMAKKMNCANPHTLQFPKLKELIERPISILSIGEGESNFIQTLIKKRASYLGMSEKNITPDYAPYFAVDVIYRDGGYNASIVTAQNRVMATHISKPQFAIKYHQHYHPGYAQDFRLRQTSTGKLMLFDEIFSSVSVGKFICWTFLSSEENGKQLLTNILDHLKPGGFLRIWPVTTPDSIFSRNKDDTATFIKRLNSTLAELRKADIIDFHNPIGFLSSYLIMRRGLG